MPKITVYTINNCPFCEEEKAYLNQHKFLFEEKNIDSNNTYLSEMLSLSDNFTGVPFTLIQKDDGSKVSLKGFTKEEFDTALGVSAVSGQDTVRQSVSAAPTTEPILITTPTAQIEPSSPPLAGPAMAEQDIPASDNTETPVQSSVSSEDAHKETFMHIPSPPHTQPLSQQGPDQDNNHNQKLKDILSNLQKISGMGDQSGSIKSGSSNVVSPSEPLVSTPPPTTAVPESPIETPTQTQSASAPFMQPHAGPTLTQSDVSPTLPTDNPSVLPTETPTTQIPTIPDFPKQ